MTLALLFWILMLLWLVFGLYWSWPYRTTAGYGVIGGNLLLFLLLLILGWAEFGSPIRP